MLVTALFLGACAASPRCWPAAGGGRRRRPTASGPRRRIGSRGDGVPDVPGAPGTLDAVAGFVDLRSPFLWTPVGSVGSRSTRCSARRAIRPAGAGALRRRPHPAGLEVDRVVARAVSRGGRTRSGRSSAPSPGAARPRSGNDQMRARRRAPALRGHRSPCRWGAGRWGNPLVYTYPPGYQAKRVPRTSALRACRRWRPAPPGSWWTGRGSPARERGRAAPPW